MDRGYIKLYRKLIDNEVFYNPNRLQLFLYLLMSANHKANKVYGVDVGRGQHLTGRKVLSANLKSVEGTVYKNLRWLQKKELIIINSNNKHTIITICNYDSYQNTITTKEQQSNNKVTTKEQRSNNKVTQTRMKRTNKNVKNDKKLSDFENSFKDFSDMRRKIKKPLTEKAQSMILARLSDLSTIESEQIEILNNSTMNCWQGVFELKNNSSSKNKPSQNIQKIEEELDDKWIQENS